MLVHAVWHEEGAHGHVAVLPWGPHVAGLHEVALRPHLHAPILPLLLRLPMPCYALVRIWALAQVGWKLWELHIRLGLLD